MDLRNLSVQYRYATITQRYRVQRVNQEVQCEWVTFWDSFSSSIHTNPTLSSVDKFNYLSSLLESSASEVITGLTLMVANYNEAIATLKRKFGYPQFIVYRHMEALLNTTVVSSHHNVKGLRKLYDSEAHIRGLQALGISVSAYGGMLSSMLVNKLPPEIRLSISCEISGDSWDVNNVMSVVEQEIGARECASVPTSGTPNTSVRPRRQIPTVATLGAIRTCMYHKCIHVHACSIHCTCVHIHMYRTCIHVHRTCIHVHACTINAYKYRHEPYMLTCTWFYRVCIHVHACTIIWCTYYTYIPTSFNLLCAKGLMKLSCNSQT